MRGLVCIWILFIGMSAWAAETSPQVSPVEIERARKKLYPGGRDEDDLKVLAALPEAATKTSVRVIQKDVHKKLFDEELKDDEAESGDAEAEH